MVKPTRPWGVGGKTESESMRDLFLHDRRRPVSDESCRALWSAVMHQAVDDIFCVVRWRPTGNLGSNIEAQRDAEIKRARERRWARGWFASNDHRVGSFLFVCQTLGMNAEGVRRALGEQLEKENEKPLTTRAA